MLILQMRWQRFKVDKTQSRDWSPDLPHSVATAVWEIQTERPPHFHMHTLKNYPECPDCLSFASAWVISVKSWKADYRVYLAPVQAIKESEEPISNQKIVMISGFIIIESKWKRYLKIVTELLWRAPFSLHIVFFKLHTKVFHGWLSLPWFQAIVLMSGFTFSSLHFLSLPIFFFFFNLELTESH